MKKLVCVMLLAMPAMAAAPAADVSGTWSVAGDVSGVPVTETCTLAQSADAKLTGSCNTSTGKYDVTGSVEGNTATFKHGGEYEGNKLVLTYTGKLGDDGAMTGTLYVDVYDVTGSFTAKKNAAAK